MDETEPTTTDGTQAGSTSAGEGGTTSGEPESYTPEQVNKLKSDAAAEFGRERKALKAEAERAAKRVELAEKKAKDLEADVERILAEKDKRELETVKGDPDALAAYHQRQSDRAKERGLAVRERELALKEQELKDSKEEVAKFRQEQAASSIAEKHNVDAATLLSLTDGSQEKMEALAQVLPKKGKAGKTSKASLTPDSGANQGGSAKKTTEELDKLAREDPAAYRAYRATQGAYK